MKAEVNIMTFTIKQPPSLMEQIFYSFSPWPNLLERDEYHEGIDLCEEARSQTALTNVTIRVIASL